MLREIPHRPWLLAVMLGFSVLTLAACDDNGAEEVGEAIEDTGEEVEDAAD